MPLHRIFHTPGTFSAQDKKDLAERITKIYVDAGLPPFYVVILFLPIETENFFVSGKNNVEKFVRISVEHLARQLPTHVQQQRFFTRYEAALAPFIKDRGLDWEVQIEEGNPNTWRENEFQPPIANSAAEKNWIRLNKAVAYLDEENK